MENTVKYGVKLWFLYGTEYNSWVYDSATVRFETTDHLEALDRCDAEQALRPNAVYIVSEIED